MFYWIIYDISNNSKRTKVATKCKNYGLIRVQKSAFVGDLTKNKIEMLGLEIKDLNLDETDCIYMLPSCNNCFKRKIFF